MRRTSVMLRAGVAAGALTLALTPILGLSAGASGGGYGPMVPVAQGFDPSQLPGTTVFGSTPSSTPEQVTFVLDEQNKSQLESMVERGVSSYLSVSQFAQSYGQSTNNIKELQGYLSGFGITTTVYPDDVDVSASGTAGEFDAALSTHQDEYGVPSFPGTDGERGVPAQTVHGTTSSPELPSQLAQFVLAVLGLSNYGSFVSQAQHLNTSVTAPEKGSSNECLALTGLPDACNTPANFESNYGLSQIERQANGSGQTIGIVTFAALDPGAPQYFWSNVLGLPNTGRSVTVDNVDGGPGAPSDASGSGETDLDVEQSGGVAPGANVIVYQAPNTDPGFADAFFTAASQNIAGSVSCSWGESETFVAAAVASGTETPAYQAAIDEAYLELAAQGQATFVAAGDAGAYEASADLGTTNLSVGTPADSPYVTAAGGTTLPWSGQLTNATGTITANVRVAQQRAWGWDYLWQPIATVLGVSLTAAAEGDVAGGGGGFSTVEPTPSYQQGVSGTQSYSAVEYLTPTDYEGVQGITEPTSWNFNPDPYVTHGQGSGRAVPDVSADADPFSGYLLYEPSFAGVGEPELQGGWGGTSFVAPQLNGSTAVIDSFVGHRVGFWNPSIYSFATSRNSPFTPLQQSGTSNDNLFYTGAPGAVYNAATGLGVPNLSELAADFQGGNFGFGQ